MGYMQRYKRGGPDPNSAFIAALKKQYPGYYRQYLANQKKQKGKGEEKRKP